MPLLKSNKKSEESDKSSSIAMAYGMKRKAKGGRVYKKHEHADSPTGEAGEMSIETRKGESPRELRDHGKELHKKKLKEMQDMPAPKLKGLAQGGMIKTAPLKHPKMVPQSLYSTRLRDEEDHLETSDAPASPTEQPPEHDNELDADKHGPELPDMETEHSEMMANGGTASSPASRLDSGFGRVIIKLADGGIAEEQEDSAASIAAAIMAKRKMMAEGGILSHDSIYSDDSDMADVSRNADEDANEEDQLSFNALRKENYSESEGLQELDYDTSKSVKHAIESDSRDMVDAIRRKMKKSPISR